MSQTLGGVIFSHEPKVWIEFRTSMSWGMFTIVAIAYEMS